MPIYAFECKDCGEVFTRFNQTLPDKPVEFSTCSCGKRAERAYGKEGFHIVGGLRTGTGKGSLAETTKTAFGSKVVGGRETGAFETTKELDKFMSGQNALGPPVVKHLDANGTPVFAKDAQGNVIHEGAKLVKYDAGATPRRSDNPKRAVNLQALDRYSKRMTGEGLWGEDPGDSFGSRK